MRDPRKRTFQLVADAANLGFFIRSKSLVEESRNVGHEALLLRCDGGESEKNKVAWAEDGLMPSETLASV